MSKKNPQPTSGGSTKPAPIFRPFAWVGEAQQRKPYNLLTDVRDIAVGVGVALQLVERTTMNNENGDPPLLDQHSTFCLTRMSIAAMRFIEERIDAEFDNMNDNIGPEVDAHQGAQP